MCFNRKDNDGHRFLIPEQLLNQFDVLLDEYTRAEKFSDRYYDLEAEFCKQFEQYMIG
jgi:hypothetical protein